MSYSRVCGLALTLFYVGCVPNAPSAEPDRVFGETGLGPGEFSYPRAIAVAPDGTLFIVDKSARVQRFSAEGKIEHSWRMPEFESGKPVGLTVHPDGRVFVADTHYHRVMVFDRDGNELARFGHEGTASGEFLLPTDVAFDRQGNVYVAEYGGNDRVSKFTPEFEYVLSIPNEASGDGALVRPAGLVFDDQDTLWVADACNHRVCRFDTNGRLLSTIGSMGREPGQLRYPYDIDVTKDGTLLVCEYGNNRIQWFSREGESLGVWGEAGRKPGQLAYPWGAACGEHGRVYVVDSGSNRVQCLRN